MKRLNDILKSIEDYISGGFIITGLMILFVQVLMRYVFNLPTTWQDESARYFIVWGVLLGSAVALRDGQHITIDIVYQSLSDKWKNIINIISNILILLFLILLIVFSLILIKNKYITGEVTNIGINIYIIYIIFPLSGLLMAYRAITNLLDYKSQ